MWIGGELHYRTRRQESVELVEWMDLIFQVSTTKDRGPSFLPPQAYSFTEKLSLILTKMVIACLSSWTFNNSSLFWFSADNFIYCISGGNGKSKRTTSFYHHQTHQLIFLCTFTLSSLLEWCHCLYPPLLLLLFSSSPTNNLFLKS